MNLAKVLRHKNQNMLSATAVVQLPSLCHSHGGNHSGKRLNETYHVRRASILLKTLHFVTPQKHITILNDIGPHNITMRC